MHCLTFLSRRGLSASFVFVVLVSLATTAVTLCPSPALAGSHGFFRKKSSPKNPEPNREPVSILHEIRPTEQSQTLTGALSFDECVEIALRENRKRPASLAAIAIAEAQHRQALSAYWPQLTLTASATLRSNEPNFIFPAQDFLLPETAIDVPASTIAIPGMSIPLNTTIQMPGTTMTIPAGVLGPNAVQIPVSPQQMAISGQAIQVPPSQFDVPAQQFNVPAQTFHLPEQNISLLDRFTYGGGVNLEFPLYTGGLRKSLRQQAKGGINAAKEDARRTDLEIIHDVRRMYYGSVLARQLEQLGSDTLKRMEATLELTEQLYQGESLQVKKTDYLRNKVVVENIRVLLETLIQNRQLAESALAHSMGLSWRSNVQPSAHDVDYRPTPLDLQTLVAHAYKFSPDWRKLHIGLDVAEAHINEQKSGRLPKVALIGDIHAYGNDLNSGLDTRQNLRAWNVGVGVELPLFRGFLTKNRVAEARARLKELQQQEVLLEEGLALQIKTLLIEMNALQRQERSSSVAVASSVENRDLTERAYQNDLIEPDDVFESHILEAMSKAKQLKTRYDHTEARSAIDTIIGSSVAEQLSL